VIILKAKHINWTGSLHQTFRLLPNKSPNLAPFLESDGHNQSYILSKLPYASARSKSGAGGSPDPKRYRDGKQVYQTVGLFYEGDDKLIHLTELGIATKRWLSIITQANSVILARHAAYALAACQLRNPTGAGDRYDKSVMVFPFQFIWRAMLALDGKINSDELNRGIFKIRNEEDLLETIKLIASARENKDKMVLGNEVVSGKGKNDRIIPWMSLASFGWTLFPDKRSAGESGYYELDPKTMHIVKEASRIRRKHREFQSVREYVEYISNCAALPKDLR